MICSTFAANDGSHGNKIRYVRLLFLETNGIYLVASSVFSEFTILGTIAVNIHDSRTLYIIVDASPGVLSKRKDTEQSLN